MTLSVPERSRGASREIGDGHVVVKVQYLLDDYDCEAVLDLDLEEAPKTLWLSRTAGPGATVVRVEPTPRNAVAPLRVALKALTRAATKKALSSLDYGKVEDGDGDEVYEGRFTFRQRLSEAVQKVVADSVTGSFVESATELGPAAWLAELDEYGIAGPIRDALQEVNRWLVRRDPALEVEKRLHNISPDILLFSEEDRTLSSTYTLSDEVISKAPAALANVAGMAELSDLPPVLGPVPLRVVTSF